MVWWPLPRWRVGHEFRWGIRPVSLLIVYFLLDIRFHIESTDGPEEEDQEDGRFICLTCILWMPDIAFWTTHHFPRYFYFNGYQLPNILISQRGTRWIRTSLLCTVMHLLKNLWAPSLGWTDLCSATLLLIGEFREVQHVWGELCLLPASSFVFSLLS